MYRVRRLSLLLSGFRLFQTEMERRQSTRQSNRIHNDTQCVTSQLETVGQAWYYLTAARTRECRLKSAARQVGRGGGGFDTISIQFHPFHTIPSVSSSFIHIHPFHSCTCVSSIYFIHFHIHFIACNSVHFTDFIRFIHLIHFHPFWIHFIYVQFPASLDNKQGG